MSSEFIAENVWAALAGGIQGTVRAAIAYVGRSAPVLLPLHSGDELIVNGDAASLESGAVSPEAIRAYIDEGVECWALDRLHAKCILSGIKVRTVIVGSANASATSRDHLAEAVLRTTDPDAVATAEVQFDLWKGQAKRIDDAWLQWAQRLYKRPPLRCAADDALPLPVDRRVWLSTSEPLEYGPPREVRSSADAQQLSLQRGYDVCETYELAQGDENRVVVGDVVVRAPLKPGKDEPHGNSGVLPWAVVTRVFPPVQGGRPWATLVLQSSASPRCSVAQLRRRVWRAGGQVNWASQKPFEPSPVTEAIWSLWAADRGD